MFYTRAAPALPLTIHRILPGRPPTIFRVLNVLMLILLVRHPI